MRFIWLAMRFCWWLRLSLCVFQFSLWDSSTHSLGCFGGDFCSFNSLYEIHISRALRQAERYSDLSILFMRFINRVYGWETCMRKPFNSLYEILVAALIWIIMETLKELSILFMRFSLESTSAQSHRTAVLSILFMRFSPINLKLISLNIG